MNKLAVGALLLLCAASVASCDDELSGIGGGLAVGEVSIEVDSTFTIVGHSVYTPVFDSRSTTNLLGRIDVPEYGRLDCSFVAQMMSAASLQIPDSIGVERVDSMLMVLSVPRGSLTGDSVAPQQLKLYSLTKELPRNIENNFNPEGYYSEESLLGKRSYTLSALSMNDSLFKKTTTIQLPVKLPLEFARKVFSDYRTDPAPFQWPSTFAKYFPGIYVGTSFGSGCIANVSKVSAVLYYYHLHKYNEIQEDKTSVEKVRHVKDSLTIFSTVPEVLSSNNIHLEVAQSVKDRVAAGDVLILSPGGYNANITFPLEDIMDRYALSDDNMTVVNELTFTLPVSTIRNDFGIGVPPTLLMIPADEVDTFFAENKVPDGKTSFWAAYNSATGVYSFTSMREYLLNAIKNRNTDHPSPSEFVLVPVSLTTQEKQISYSQTITIVTGCTPYISRPTMCVLNLGDAKIRFTYSLQKVD